MLLRVSLCLTASLILLDPLRPLAQVSGDGAVRPLASSRNCFVIFIGILFIVFVHPVGDTDLVGL